MSVQPPITRRLWLAAAGAVLACPAAVRAQTAASGRATATAFAADAARVSRAVAAVTRLQGRFAQTNPDGSASGGRFWMQRPGRLRFEYDAPSPLLMVVDGTNVAVRDARLNTTNRYPLRGTPLWFLLKSDVDLARDVTVSASERRQGRLVMTMRDRRREADGELTIVVREAGNQLEEWSIRDGQGRVTRVRLIETSVPASLAASLFVLREPPSRRQR